MCIDVYPVNHTPLNILTMAIVVRYDDEVVGEFVADIVVEGTIIVELKSVRRMALCHEIQLVNYLAATGAESQGAQKTIERVFPSRLSCHPVKKGFAPFPRGLGGVGPSHVSRLTVV